MKYHSFGIIEVTVLHIVPFSFSDKKTGAVVKLFAVSALIPSISDRLVTVNSQVAIPLGKGKYEITLRPKNESEMKLGLTVPESAAKS